ncbi:MAG: AAA family ATPase [Chitinispirillales bacterium]|jgi:predicted ATPase|nr:AAA family ATPase [Chitinispirillales bacterium]
MKIESIRLKNFKAFQDVEMRDIPKLCVLVGANGTGKSSFFSVFGFLKDAFNGNVNTALAKLGGARGFDEVMSRNSSGSIEIELKFREKPAKDSPLITYFLQIGKKNGRACVEREILKYRLGSSGKPWHFLDFENGIGEAVVNELDSVKTESDLVREPQNLKSNDILAVKGLAQFERFPAARLLGDLIENWHISDFHISHARREQDAGYAEHLSRDGENLGLVVQYLFQNHKETFDKILSVMTKRIPGVVDANAETDSEGKVLLRFRDGAFTDTFLARFVSDGTIKMLAYLVLLYDPNPFPLLCVEEPENQLYLSILVELVEEFRDYARRGGQVFVSTHSPDFLNAVELDEVFWLEKKDGYTKIMRAKENKQIAAYMNDGDKMGYLWKQGFFGGVDPK